MFNILKKRLIRFKKKMMLFSDNISMMLFEYSNGKDKLDPVKVDELVITLHRMEKQMEASRDAIGKILEIQIDEFRARTGK